MGSLQPSASHCVRPLTGCDGGPLRQAPSSFFIGNGSVQVNATPEAPFLLAKKHSAAEGFRLVPHALPPGSFLAYQFRSKTSCLRPIFIHTDIADHPVSKRVTLQSYLFLIKIETDSPMSWSGSFHETQLGGGRWLIRGPIIRLWLLAM